ncbi:hypothetical protein K0M31_006343 [Melipona bicolor]|uniref:Uncharacterized protein n=1 Tax=Melipona bicolor TaxID=60889 RepID=A0AA40KLT4_9HYME|nr:hypothetical protein K0M31_006343 [Melipona bicolor]
MSRVQRSGPAISGDIEKEERPARGALVAGVGRWCSKVTVRERLNRGERADGSDDGGDGSTVVVVVVVIVVVASTTTTTTKILIERRGLG